MAYALYYWPNIQGRGEFVRLALEASGSPYRDVCREDGVAAMARVVEQADTPPFACPFLVDDGQVIGQAAAILQHVGPKIGLAPQDPGARLWLNQIQLTITDFVAEVHDTHHPLGAALYYEEQKPEAKRRTEGFLTQRLPKYLDWLSAVLARNPAGPNYSVGDALSYADTSVFQMVEGLSYAFPSSMRQLAGKWPLVAALHTRVAQLPALAAYLASDRRLAFNEAGVFRYYTELNH